MGIVRIISTEQAQTCGRHSDLPLPTNIYSVGLVLPVSL